MPRSATKPHILVIGDVMLDEYLHGEVTRMSPELATAPILDIHTREVRLGGAANVAHNITQLGGTAELIGIYGEDTASHTMDTLLKKAKIQNHLVRTTRPTTLKTRLMDRGKQVMRVDIEDRTDLNPKIQKYLIAAITKSTATAVIVSDYAKGVFSKAIVKALIKKFGGDAIIADIKPVNAELVRGLGVITPNRHEALAMVGANREDRALAVALRKKLGVNVAVTLGEHGSVICDTENAEGTYVSPYPVTAQDVTGAGDTFTAALALARAQHLSLAEAARKANIAAAIAVSKAGTVAVHQDELRGL